MQPQIKSTDPGLSREDAGCCCPRPLMSASQSANWAGAATLFPKGRNGKVSACSVVTRDQLWVSGWLWISSQIFLGPPFYPFLQNLPWIFWKCHHEACRRRTMLSRLWNLHNRVEPAWFKSSPREPSSLNTEDTGRTTVQLSFTVFKMLTHLGKFNVLTSV